MTTDNGLIRLYFKWETMDYSAVVHVGDNESLKVHVENLLGTMKSTWLPEQEEALEALDLDVIIGTIQDTVDSLFNEQDTTCSVSLTETKINDRLIS